jgi:carbon-monoxide dehydrogenase medium subunit
MITRFNKYFQPKTIQECCELLSEYGDNARLLAGGTDLVALLKNEQIRPEVVIGMRELTGLTGISITDQGLKVGALESLWNIERCKELEDEYQVIRESSGNVSSIQVRMIATIGGNACNASPGADGIQGMLLMDGVVNITNGKKNRQVLLEDFIVGPGETVLEKDEIVESFFVPKPPDNTGCWYEKYTMRGNSDISIVGVGARVTLDDKGLVSDCRISLASVAPTPFRAVEGENLIKGKEITEELLIQVADLVAKSITPISDSRGSAEYRREMAKVWTVNSLKKALERAKK